MSEALSHALEQIDDRLVRGLKEAERELAQTRERCDRLEEDVRLIKAALEPSVLGPDELLVIPPVASEPMVAEPEVAEAMPAEPIASLPDVAEPEAIEPELDVVVTIPPAEDVSADASEEDAAPGEEPTQFAQYMPMLEELWEIANRDQ